MGDKLYAMQMTPYGAGQLVHVGSYRHSCFAAGTPVATSFGRRPIEELQTGDHVLSQDPATGELAYLPVLQRTKRTSRELLSLGVGGETIHVTRGHLFWVVGCGWTAAKELHVGQVLHAPSGKTAVTAIGTSEPNDVYNLVVADHSTYFVGDAQLLVHDNTTPKSATTLVPGATWPAE